MEQRALKRRRRRFAALVVVAIAVAGSIAAWRLARRPSVSATAPRDVAGADTVHAPDGVRIRVEVLNATTVRGLGRKATRWLRDGGFDVVYTGTTKGPLTETTVLARSGRMDWAQQVARRLGGAKVEARPDSSRYLDVTVLLGSSFRSPSQALDP